MADPSLLMQGDVVQFLQPGKLTFSPYLGRVLKNLPLGVVEVVFPFGHRQVPREQLVQVNPDLSKYLPPGLTSEGDTVLRVGRWSSIPDRVYRVIASAWHEGQSDLESYDLAFRVDAGQTSDILLRSAVQQMYALSEKWTASRVAHACRLATYWVARDRKHRATSQEISNGYPNCPRCGIGLKRTIYKMADGVKHKVFACPSCFILLDPDSIVDGQGQVIWPGQ